MNDYDGGRAARKLTGNADNARRSTFNARRALCARVSLRILFSQQLNITKSTQCLVMKIVQGWSIAQFARNRPVRYNSPSRRRTVKRNVPRRWYVVDRARQMVAIPRRSASIKEVRDTIVTVMNGHQRGRIVFNAQRTYHCTMCDVSKHNDRESEAALTTVYSYHHHSRNKDYRPLAQ